jgi:Xaa-Pro dipeptidase
MEQKSVRESGWKYDIIAYDDTEDPWEMIANNFNKILKKNCLIAIEKNNLIVAKFEKIRSITEGAEFINAEQILNDLRLIKDSEEISILKEAAKFADLGVEIGISEISKGKSELEIIAKIESELKAKGIQKMSFDTMVLFGAKSAEPHGVPGLNTVCKGDFVLFDLGVVYQGYCSDISRTVAYGHVTEKQLEIYYTVLQAQINAINVARKDIKIMEVDLAARNHISNAGYGDFFTHRVGHGLGILIHEYPSLHSKNEDILKEGMVFTIEPGIYVPNIGGVRIEDDIVITEEGNDILTSFTKELLIIK